MRTTTRPSFCMPSTEHEPMQAQILSMGTEPLCAHIGAFDWVNAHRKKVKAGTRRVSMLIPACPTHRRVMYPGPHTLTGCIHMAVMLSCKSTIRGCPPVMSALLLVIPSWPPFPVPSEGFFFFLRINSSC